MPNRMDKVASDLMGAAKAARATVEGLSGVFKHLAREHGEVTALLLRAKMTTDPKVRAELFPQIQMELLSHEKGELAEVYPVFRERTELAQFADDHERAAGQLEAHLNAVAELPYDDASWKDRMAALVDLVSRHAKEEETRYFPAAERALGRSAAEQMLTRYEAAKAQAAKAIET